MPQFVCLEFVKIEVGNVVIVQLEPFEERNSPIFLMDFVKFVGTEEERLQVSVMKTGNHFDLVASQIEFDEIWEVSLV